MPRNLGVLIFVLILILIPLQSEIKKKIKIKPELRSRKREELGEVPPECPESFRGSNARQTQSWDIFKRFSCHVAVAEDGHTPSVAKSYFGVRVKSGSRCAAVAITTSPNARLAIDQCLAIKTNNNVP